MIIIAKIERVMMCNNAGGFISEENFTTVDFDEDNIFIACFRISANTQGGKDRSADVFLLTDSGDKERFFAWYEGNIDSVFEHALNDVAKPMYLLDNFDMLPEAVGKGAEALAAFVEANIGIKTVCFVAQPFNDGQSERVYSSLAKDMAVFSACFENEDKELGQAVLMVFKADSDDHAARIREIVADMNSSIYARIKEAEKLGEQAMVEALDIIFPDILHQGDVEEGYCLHADFFVAFTVAEKQQ